MKRSRSTNAPWRSMRRRWARTTPTTATILNDLASLYAAQGRHAEAEPLFRRALAIREKVLGPDHPYVATTLGNLGGLYLALGRHAETEPLLERALVIRESALGPEHPDVAESLNNLAIVYRRQGRYGEAESLQPEGSGRSMEKTLGPDHPSTATVLKNLRQVVPGARPRRGGRRAAPGRLVDRRATLPLIRAGLANPVLRSDGSRRQSRPACPRLFSGSPLYCVLLYGWLTLPSFSGLTRKGTGLGSERDTGLAHRQVSVAMVRR